MRPVTTTAAKIGSALIVFSDFARRGVSPPYTQQRAVCLIDFLIGTTGWLISRRRLRGSVTLTQFGLGIWKIELVLEL